MSSTSLGGGACSKGEPGVAGREPSTTTAPTPERPASASVDPWQRIDALARAQPDSPPHADLSRALESAERAESSPAVEALVRWSQVGDGKLPPVSPIPARIAFELRRLGKLAIEASSSEAPSGLAAAAHLGSCLVLQGRNLIEVSAGVSLLRDAQRKARELAVPTSAWRLPASSELVRITAAEAMHNRRMAAYFRSPDGRRALDAELAKLAPDQRLAAEQQVPTPSAAELDALDAFWLAALDGAREGEPAAETLARLRQAHAAVRDDQVAIVLASAIRHLDWLATEISELAK